MYERWHPFRRCKDSFAILFVADCSGSFLLPERRAEGRRSRTIDLVASGGLARYLYRHLLHRLGTSSMGSDGRDVRPCSKVESFRYHGLHVLVLSLLHYEILQQHYQHLRQSHDLLDVRRLLRFERSIHIVHTT